MRRTALGLAALAGVSVLALAAPALAHPDVVLEPTLPTDLTYSSTDNVEFLGRFPEHAGTAGGALSPDGKRFFLTDPRGVYIYDVKDPASPRLTGSLPLFQTTTGAALAQEDPETNGSILLVDAATTPVGTAVLNVVDVSGTTPKVLSTLSVTDHTWSCISGRNAKGKKDRCAYAYGRTGHVIDLTDPTKAKLLPETWRSSAEYGNKSNSPYTHDVTELRPGLAMTAGSTALLLDTRNPKAPKRLAAIEQKGRFPSLGYHSVEWAQGGRDPYVVLGTEIAPSGATNSAGSDCKGESSVIETWDARSIVKAVSAHYDRGVPAAKAFRGAAFKKVDAFDAASRGVFVTGAAPGHVLYCAHWMELHPSFKGRGTMAVSYYDRGTRFVDVDAKGVMKEIGWITAAEGYSGSPQWITKDVVYVMDYRRGLEVVRLMPGKATAVRSGSADLISARSTGVTVLGVGAIGGRLAGTGAPISEVGKGLLGLAPALLLLAVVAVRRQARGVLPASAA
jgi:hypothetical protein